jgi:hypothetical protein
LPVLNLNFLQPNKTTIPFTLNSDTIEWMKPFLIDHSKGIEGTQIRTSSGDVFAVTESYQRMREMLGHPGLINEVVPVPQRATQDVHPINETSAADTVFGRSGAASGIADPASIDR